jgi:FkbM family methyltransferase
VDWPAAVLRPRLVRVGSSTDIYLTPHNREFDIEAVLGGRLTYEPEVFALLDKIADTYDTVIEIGANVGIFTTYLATRLMATRPDARIFAFEPSAEAYRRLHENLALNTSQNVTALNAAISFRSGFARFYEPRGHLTNGSLNMDFASSFDEIPSQNWIVTLKGASLFELTKDAKRILFKIDVEGFEAEVLRSLAPIIEQQRPDILIEALPDFEAAINDTMDFSALGYRFYGLASDGLVAIDRIGTVDGRDCFLTACNDTVAIALRHDSAVR